MARRLVLVLLSLVVLAALAAGGALAWVAWRPGDLKGPLTRLASDRLGARVRVEGPLGLDLGRVATVSLEGLRVGAPEWAAADNLVEVDALLLGIDLPASWRERALVLSELRLTRPRVALERDAEGRTSWPDLGGGEEDPEDDGAAGFRLGALEIEEGRVAYRDAVARAELEARVDTTPPPPGSAAGGGLGGLTLDGAGRVDGRELGFALEVGSPLALQARAAGDAATPFPVKGRLTLPGSTATLDGSLRDPLTLAGLSLGVALDSPEPARLLGLLLGRADAALPPGLTLRGRIERPDAGGEFALTGLDAAWGESRLAGEARYRPAAPAADGGVAGRPRVDVRLASPFLDLGPFAGASLGTAPPAAEDPPADPAPTAGGAPPPPPTAALAAYDGRLTLDLAEVRPPAGLPPLREVALAAALEAGRLTVAPLRVTTPGGRLEGQVETGPLDIGQPEAAVTLAAEGLDLAPLLVPAVVPPEQGVGGRLTGRLEGTVRGATADELLARSALAFSGRLEAPRAAGLSLRGAAVEARLADGRLVLDPLSVDAPEGRVAGRVEAAGLGTAAPEATLALAAEGLGLGSLLAQAGLVPAEAGLAGRFTGKLDGTLRDLTAPPADLLARSALTLDGRLEGARYGGADLGGATFRAGLAEGRLTLDPLRAALPQGRVEGRAAVAVASLLGAGEGRPAEGEIDLRAEAVDLAAVLGPEAGVAGVLAGTLKGTLKGIDAATLLRDSPLLFQGRAERLRLPQLGERLPAADLSAEIRPGQRRPVRLGIAGDLGGQPLKIDAEGGPAPVLLARTGAYPLVLRTSLGETRAGAEGSVAFPLADGRLDLALTLEGQDPGSVAALFDLPAVELPPYRLAGNLARRGPDYRLTNLEGRVGDSDVAGELSLDLGGPRPAVAGRLRSKVLDLDDLGGLLGGEPAAGPGETASGEQRAEAAKDAPARDGAVIPDDRLDPSRWNRLDADLKLVADEVRAGRLPFDGFDLGVALKAGRLRVEPLSLRLGDGRLEGTAALDARRVPAAADLDLTLTRLPVARLLSRLDVDASAFGTLSGRARGGAAVEGTGQSLKQILAGGDGEVTLLMEGGSVNRRLVSAIGFDLLRLAGSLLGSGTPEQLDIGCALADLVLKDGRLETRSLVLDTPAAQIAGEGGVDLRSERIDLALIARPKGVPLPGGRTGIRVGGTLAAPEVELNPVRLLARGAAAATFGVVLRPFSAIASSLGGGRPAPGGAGCAPLLEAEGGRGGDGDGGGRERR